MNGVAATLLSLAALAGVANWWSVATSRRHAEWITKPLVMVLLIAVVIGIEPVDAAVRNWFLVALVAGLAGDVFLMLEPERFIAGLASFLVAHLAYVGGFVSAGLDVVLAVVTAGVVLVAVAAVGLPIQRGAIRNDRALGLPVAAYIVVISGFLIAAVASQNAIAALGAALFYVSDSILGWNKFVAPPPRARVAIMVTYHGAQALLVVSLVV